MTESPGDSTGGTAGPTGSGTTAGTGGECQTVLCGDPGQCCAEDEDCAAGSCMPACASGVRCGPDQDICCDDGQVCLSDACATPNGDCMDSFDCDLGEFCEPTLEQCLPQFDPVSCEIIPEFEDIDATLEWAWTVDEVISIPVVADLDGNGAPDVVLNVTQQDAQSWPGGAIQVLDGRNGAELLRIDDNPAADEFGSHGRATLGVTDVSGDGLPDIIYAGRPGAGGSLVHAVDFAGNLLWTSHDDTGADYRLEIENGGPSFANFDGDDEAEIAFGSALLDHDGLVVADPGGVGAMDGTNSGYTGGISALADFTGDGYPEIISGKSAWTVDWVDMGAAPPMVTVSLLWDAGDPDGYPAIADVDLDGTPEVILAANGTVRILNSDGELYCGVDPTDAMCVADPLLRTQAVPIPGGGRGGPPTVADFDGDGLPEFASAAGGSYSVYDLFRPGEDVVQPVGDPPAQLGDLYVRWSQPTQDLSSNATGSSVFDFQGDGIAEVVYADECYMRVYSGFDGSVVLQLESSSATIHEYPLVVDVDDDGNSEILVVANDTHASCDAVAGYTYRRGLYVYGDTFDRWVGTRRVWTSNAYHVTNATSAGNAPVTEVDNWTQPSLNNYRQNVQGAGVFNAPDLTVELALGLGGCLDEELEVLATVRNIGALGVPAGIDVSLYQGTDAGGTLVGTQQTPDPLLPGGQVQLSWVVAFPAGSAAMDYYVAVDGADLAVDGAVIECDESNNDAGTETAACPTPG